MLDKEKYIKEQIFFDLLNVTWLSSPILFSGVKFRTKFQVLLQTISADFGQSLPLKSLEIRLFYRKLNSRKRGNSLSVTEILLNTAMIRGNLH